MDYTICVVDDDHRFCESLKALLTTRSYKVHICNNSTAALNFLNNGKSDLLLLDIFIDEMDGFQIFKTIQNQKLNTSVILMTGSASTESAVKALRMGADDYLRKPFEPEQLFSAIKNTRDKRLLQEKNKSLIRKACENEKKQRTIFDSSFDAIVILDQDNSKIIDCNSAAVNLFNAGKKNNLIGLTPDQLSPRLQPNGKSSQKLAEEHIRFAVRKGGIEFEWTSCTIDGNEFPALIGLSPMNFNGKNFLVAIGKNITRRKQAQEGREKLIKMLQESLENVKTLSGMLPICAKCKKIRDDKGYWNRIEAFIEEHSHALFSHSMCPECMDKTYGDEDWYGKNSS